MMLNRPDPSRLHPQPLPRTWWLRRRSYFLFLVREFTSLFIAAYLVLLMAGLYQLGSGHEAYSEWQGRMAEPGWILLHGVILVFAVFHSVTWFQTTSIVIELKAGGVKLPRAMFTALNVAAWLAVSAFIVILFQSR